MDVIDTASRQVEHDDEEQSPIYTDEPRACSLDLWGEVQNVTIRKQLFVLQPVTDNFLFYAGVQYSINNTENSVAKAIVIQM